MNEMPSETLMYVGFIVFALLGICLGYFRSRKKNEKLQTWFEKIARRHRGSVRRKVLNLSLSIPRKGGSITIENLANSNTGGHREYFLKLERKSESYRALPDFDIEKKYWMVSYIVGYEEYKTGNPSFDQLFKTFIKGSREKFMLYLDAEKQQQLTRLCEASPEQDERTRTTSTGKLDVKKYSNRFSIKYELSGLNGMDENEIRCVVEDLVETCDVFSSPSR
jgi:hypothetical protein